MALHQTQLSGDGGAFNVLFPCMSIRLQNKLTREKEMVYCIQDNIWLYYIAAGVVLYSFRCNKRPIYQIASHDLLTNTDGFNCTFITTVKLKSETLYLEVDL